MNRMKLVHRYDYNPSSSAAETTPEGFLMVTARATRTGVLKYRMADGSTVRELRHPDEVFKPESMATLGMKPVTNNHPKGLLDSGTATMHQVGSTGENVVVVDGKYLEVKTVITDEKTIKDAAGGKVEVSPGYTCELDFTPGTYDGEEYDAIQRNIRYNHLAVVKKGRSGPEVRLRLDAEDAVQIDLNQKETKTMKLKLNGKEYEVADDAGAAMQAALDDAANKARPVAEEMDAMKKDAKDAKAKAKAAEEEKDKAQAKADSLEVEVEKLKKAKMDAESVDVKKLVKARMAIEKVASAIGIAKFDEMDDADLKKAVIVAHDPKVKLDGKSEDYIEARFDMAAESISDSDETAREIGLRLAGKERTDATEVMDSDAARQRMIERNKTLYTGEKAKA